MLKSSIISEIKKLMICGVVRCENDQRALDISKALIEGGFKLIEINQNTTNSCNAIKELSQNKDIMIAAGGIITNKQAEESVEAGAELIVSPVLELNLIKLSKGLKVPIIAGASTANEAYSAWKLGVNLVKIFPVNAMGGHEYIKEILKQMPFLNLMPTSGVQPDDFTDYLKAGATAVGIGNTLYEGKNFKEITKAATEVIDRLEELKV